MGQATYTANVSVEEIKFSDEAKKQAKVGAGGKDVRFEAGADEKSHAYFQIRTIGGEATKVYEGDSIVTHADGSSEVIPAGQVKDQLAGFKEVKAGTPASTKDIHAAAVKADKTLAQRAAENGNNLNSQSNAEAKVIAEENKPAVAAFQAATGTPSTDELTPEAKAAKK